MATRSSSCSGSSPPSVCAPPPSSRCSRPRSYGTARCRAPERATWGLLGGVAMELALCLVMLTKVTGTVMAGRLDTDPPGAQVGETAEVGVGHLRIDARVVDLSATVRIRGGHRLARYPTRRSGTGAEARPCRDRWNMSLEVPRVGWR